MFPSVDLVLDDLKRLRSRFIPLAVPSASDRLHWPCLLILGDWEAIKMKKVA